MTQHVYETIQATVIALAIVAGIGGTIRGVIVLHRQSADYWKSITLACIDAGGTLAGDGQCYGAHK